MGSLQKGGGLAGKKGPEDHGPPQPEYNRGNAEREGSARSGLNPSTSRRPTERRKKTRGMPGSRKIAKVAEAGLEHPQKSSGKTRIGPPMAQNPAQSAHALAIAIALLSQTEGKTDADAARLATALDLLERLATAAAGERGRP